LGQQGHALINRQTVPGLLLVTLPNLGILATGLLGFSIPGRYLFRALWLGKFMLEFFSYKDAAAFFNQQYPASLLRCCCSRCTSYTLSSPVFSDSLKPINGKEEN